MIERNHKHRIGRSLEEAPAVVLLGPRQIGKTTLAREIASESPGSVYLDLEDPADAALLSDPGRYLDLHAGSLLILDEVQRVPGLFQVLRGRIDARRREGHRTRQFLLLGSASTTLLNQSAESLAGRALYYELPGLDATEVGGRRDALWVRGGFPDAFTAASDAGSGRWRLALIRTYLEREIALFATRLPAETLRRFWTMLAHRQGGLLNASALAQSLGVSSPTVSRYVDLLVNLMLVRRLQPYFANVGKRLIKTPKIYIRDSGIVHSLLGLRTLEDVLSHPVAGPSWEGFVVENLLSAAPFGTDAWFYRTRAGAEIDLLLAPPDQRLRAIEIKRSSAPRTSKGFEIATGDLDVTERFVVYPGNREFPLSARTLAIPLEALMERLAYPDFV
ncbi:ATP-binding protein [Candidatus Palauibacter sp.]|uniref:ATP-binding protein n=1 Tax=Candidatus Palauibacter sp. TaxID=3101350 RepID=UPI003AF2C8B1